MKSNAASIVHEEANRYWTGYAATLYSEHNPKKEARAEAEKNVRRWTRISEGEPLTDVQLPAVFLQQMLEAFQEAYANPENEPTLTGANLELYKTLINIFDPLGCSTAPERVVFEVSGVHTCMTQMAQARGKTASGSGDKSLAQADFEATLDACMGLLPQQFVEKMLNPEIAQCRKLNDFPRVEVSHIKPAGRLEALVVGKKL